jgi:hypothetical protein
MKESNTQNHFWWKCLWVILYPPKKREKNNVCVCVLLIFNIKTRMADPSSSTPTIQNVITANRTVVTPADVPCSIQRGYITKEMKWAALNGTFHGEVKKEINGSSHPTPKLTLDMEGAPVQCVIDNTPKWVVQLEGCPSRTYVAFDDSSLTCNPTYVTVEQLLPMMRVAVAQMICPTCENALKKRRDGFYGCSQYSLTNDYNVCVTKISTPELIRQARLKNYRSLIRSLFPAAADYTQSELLDATKSCLALNMAECNRTWDAFCNDSTEEWRTKTQRRKHFTRWLTMLNAEQQSLFSPEQLDILEQQRLLQNAARNTHKRKRTTPPENEIHVIDDSDSSSDETAENKRGSSEDE